MKFMRNIFGWFGWFFCEIAFRVWDRTTDRAWEAHWIATGEERDRPIYQHLGDFVARVFYAIGSKFYYLEDRP